MGRSPESSGGHSPGRSPEIRRQVVADSLQTISEHPLVEEFSPAIIGEGGVHAVFDFPKKKEAEGRRNVLAKVHRPLLFSNLERNLTAGLPLDTLSPQQKTAIERRLLRDREAFKVLKKYFGGAVLGQRERLQKVPVSNEVLARLASSRETPLTIPPDVHEAWTTVVFQERAPPEALGERSLALQDVYLEKNKLLDDELYQTINARLLDGQLPERVYGLAAFSRALDVLLERAAEDEDLKAALRSFADTCIRYTEDTGEILDLVGPDNARIYQDSESQWKTILLDALSPGQEWIRAREAIRAMQRGLDARGESVTMANALNYARFVNALEIGVGGKERLRLSDQPIAPLSRKLKRTIGALFEKS